MVCPIAPRHALPASTSFPEDLLKGFKGSLNARTRAFKGINCLCPEARVHARAGAHHPVRPGYERAAKDQDFVFTQGGATASLSLSNSAERENQVAFHTNTCNLLISMYFPEEGMTFPSANCVFRFDPVQHAVSYVQARGRAR